MKASWVGFRIWIVTVLLTVLTMGIFIVIDALYVSLQDLISGILLMSFVGLVVSIPFLVLTISLIHIVKRFPYDLAGKMAWLFAMESIFVLLFYAGLEYLIDGRFGIANDFARMLTGTTIAAFLVALYLIRGAFARASAGSSTAAASTETNSTIS